MKYLYTVSLIVLVFYLLLSCDDQPVNKVDPPARVVLISNSADTSSVEHGIDAIYLNESPDKNSIFFEWRPNGESTLAGYEMYRSVFANQNYTSLARVVENFGIIDTFYIDNSISLNIRYYYFIRAFDDLDQYGEPSDTISYEVIENPILLGSIITDTTALEFIWNFPAFAVPQYFVFRLEISENEIYRNLYSKLIEISVEYGQHQEWTLAELTQETTLSPGKYRWRIDSIGSEYNQGAESAWFIFIIQ
ncbi:MAG: hypothetical protein A2Y94_11030 [Caldithrix sp. RBG_13_44_9]|nr:MAG: hypothetical protein A2Y94_11030 [Caldithrix sp. RBG_13_44_9]